MFNKSLEHRTTVLETRLEMLVQNNTQQFDRLETDMLKMNSTLTIGFDSLDSKLSHAFEQRSKDNDNRYTTLPDVQREIDKSKSTWLVHWKYWVAGFGLAVTVLKYMYAHGMV